MNPRDLTINIRAATAPRNLLNGGPKNATFPGWFVTVMQNEGYDVIVPPTQLDIRQVIPITQQIDKICDTDVPRMWTTAAANACEKAMHEDIVRQLAAAEAQAAKIPELKRLLGVE